LVQCLFTDILLVLLQEFYVSGKHPWDVGMSTYPSRNIRHAKQVWCLEYYKANMPCCGCSIKKMLKYRWEL
jgi:hypothetical protein